MSRSPETTAGATPSPSFSIEELAYDLPEELIAQTPADRRDGARLLQLDRRTGALTDSVIANLVDLLHPDDLLVLNDTKVIPAKFKAQRETGGEIQGLFECEQQPNEWEVMLAPSRRLRPGETLRLIRPGDATEPDSTAQIELTQSLGDGRWKVTLKADETTYATLDRFGLTPLPPYIQRNDDASRVDAEDRQRYQTVYARHAGAVAAPTAGLHLTQTMLGTMKEKGIQTAHVTLHVGAGTFSPIRVTDLAKHTMHHERYDLPEETAQRISDCRKRGGRVVAVGTTTVRVLEAMADPAQSGHVRTGSGSTNIFIYPPMQLSVVDVLLTNFHLPQSTLLALVMALGGMEQVRNAYRHAIKQCYRFYSFGDAMLIQ